MARILIAHGAEEFTDGLTRYLHPKHTLFLCRTGPEVLQCIGQLRPDALVIALRLPIISGLEVLQTMDYRPPVIIAVTDLVSPAVLQAAAEAGVQALLPALFHCRAACDKIDALICEKCPLPGP